MLLRYFYDQKLAHASYLLGCQATGEALLVDPGRHLDGYLAEAERQGMQIVAVTETHIHADFLSGARELAERVGARLYLSAEGGEAWQYGSLDSYDHQRLRDGDHFRIGNILIEVMHTPGHTPEHLAFLVTDTAHASAPMGLFAGDFVFVGDVGRPDLLERAAGVAGTAEAGARRLFQSLQRFKQLPEYLQLWPAHGAGSACGKALGAVPSSTVGYECRFNWALQSDDEAAFVQAVLAGQPEPPRYFATMKALNRDGAPLLQGQPEPPWLPLEQLPGLLDRGVVVVDTRPAVAFAAGHLPGTINIPADGSFITWAGWLLSYEAPFALIVEARQRQAVLRDLQAIGLDTIAGTFDPQTLSVWAGQRQPLAAYRVATPPEVAAPILEGEVTVIDVRYASEWEGGHLPGARHIMLGHLPERLAELPRDRPVIVQCQSGVRSAIAASLLCAHGFTDVTNLLGGFRAWAEAGLPISQNGHPA